MSLKSFKPVLRNKFVTQMALNSLKQIYLNNIHVRNYSKCANKKEKNDKVLNAFKACLYKRLNKQNVEEGNKVSIVGAGAVGMACCMALLCKGITNNVALYDVRKDICSAERCDMLDGSLFLNNCRMAPGCDVSVTKDSRIVVITAGLRPTATQTRLEVAQGTADILKELMPKLVAQSPKAVYIILSNPADVMTWVARKFGNLPYERCFSTGCHLDTARFRRYLSDTLNIAPSSVHGYVLGEHGGSSVPIWSSVTVGGVRLKTLLPHIGTDKDPMKWSHLHKDVVESAFKLIAIKGYTNWAIGLATVDVISAIFENSNRVITLSTNAAGMCGIKDEIFLSLPCIVSQEGLHAIMRPYMSDWERKALHKSAEELLKAQCGIKL